MRSVVIGKNDKTFYTKFSANSSMVSFVLSSANRVKTPSSSRPGIMRQYTARIYANVRSGAVSIYGGMRDIGQNPQIYLVFKIICFSYGQKIYSTRFDMYYVEKSVHSDDGAARSSGADINSAAL